MRYLRTDAGVCASTGPVCAHACAGALRTRARLDAPHATSASAHVPWRSCRQALWRHGRGPVAQRAARLRVLAAKVCSFRLVAAIARKCLPPFANRLQRQARAVKSDLVHACLWCVARVHILPAHAGSYGCAPGFGCRLTGMG